MALSWKFYPEMVWLRAVLACILGPGPGIPGQTRCCSQRRSPSLCGSRRRCRRSNERPPVGSASGYTNGTDWDSWCASQSDPRTPRIGKFWQVDRPLTSTESQGTSRGSLVAANTTDQCRMLLCSCNAGVTWLFLSAELRPQGSLKWFEAINIHLIV